MKRNILLLVLMSLVSVTQAVSAKPAVPSWRDSRPWSTEVATVIVGDVSLQAEIADTSALQTRGLSYRDSLAPGTAMLFDFGSPSPRSFWMREMRFCLDIIWIEDGKITGAAENACPNPNVPTSELARYTSGVPVTYVLEVPAGWMEEHGFEPGTDVTIIFPE